MILKCLATGSNGNCHLLDNGNEVLILDCGIPEIKIKKGLNFDVSRIAGICVTHKHSDHSKAVNDFRRMGFDVFTPYEQSKKKPQTRHFGSFKVTALPMLDKEMKAWQHTNTDLSECPCYAFLIEADNQKILYCTDTKLCTWVLKEKKINHMILGIDYQEELLAEEDSKNPHVLRGHLSLSTGCDMVKTNKTNALRSVILCHMSAESADPDKMIVEVKKAAGSGVIVDTAAAGRERELSLFPF